MKNKLILGILFLMFIIQGCKKDDILILDDPQVNFENLLTRAELNQKYGQIIKETKGFKWNDLSDLELASAFSMAQTNIVTIAWPIKSSSDFEKDEILNFIKNAEPQNGTEKDEQILEIDTELNLINARIEKVETLINLRNLNEVVGLDVYYNPLTPEQQIQGYQKIKAAQVEKLSNNNQHTARINNGIVTKDPNVGANHNIYSAWNAPENLDGDGIKIVVVDVGITPGDPIFKNGGVYDQLNPDSPLFRDGFFKDCWWCPWQGYDGPYSNPNVLEGVFNGHGVGRLTEIGEPYGDGGADDITGVAYNSSLGSFRASQSIAIDLSPNIFNNVMAIKRTYNHIKNTDIKIVSMSMGAVADWYQIERAIKDIDNKLIFNAGGTFPVGILLEMVIFQSIGDFTLFPARMQETIACTGVNYFNGVPVWSPMTFGNVDFVSHHNFPSGTSSEAVAYNAGMAALIWGTNPNLSANDVYNKMKEASDSPSRGIPFFGYGRVDMERFLNNENNQETTTIITLKGNNNRYVSRENGINSMKCNRRSVGSWEKFELIELTGDKVALKGTNGKYVSSENGRRSMKCNRSAIGPWEKFTIVNLAHGKIALRGSNGKYVSSENGWRSMRCNRNSIGPWEKFNITTIN